MNEVGLLIILKELGCLIHHYHCHAFMLGNIEYFFDHLSTDVSQHYFSFVKNNGLCHNIKSGCTLHYQFRTRQGRREIRRVYNFALVDLLRHGGLSFLQSILQLYHVHCADSGVTYSPHFREEGGLRHHVFLVFFWYLFPLGSCLH